MKKLLIASLACTALTIFSCSKHAAPAPTLTDVTGTFKYIGYAGGFAGFKFTAQPAENYLQFSTSGNKAMFKSGDSTQNCGTFAFAKNAESNSGLLTFSNGVYGGDAFGNRYNASLLHDTLVLYPTDCMDCMEAYYKAVDKQFNWCTDAPSGDDH